MRSTLVQGTVEGDARKRLARTWWRRKGGVWLPLVASTRHTLSRCAAPLPAAPTRQVIGEVTNMSFSRCVNKAVP